MGVIKRHDQRGHDSSVVLVRTTADELHERLSRSDVLSRISPDDEQVMSKKPKFLYRLREYESWFASLGRKRIAMKRDGVADWGVKERKLLVRELLKKRSVTERHFRWHEVYEPVLNKSYAYAISDLKKNHKQAYKYAMIKGEFAVTNAFPDEVTTERAVRDAMTELGYGEADLSLPQ
jgi:hypothetical protein